MMAVHLLMSFVEVVLEDQPKDPDTELTSKTLHPQKID